jgi:hypothetical protein
MGDGVGERLEVLVGRRQFRRALVDPDLELRVERPDLGLGRAELLRMLMLALTAASALSWSVVASSKMLKTASWVSLSCCLCSSPSSRSRMAPA